VHSSQFILHSLNSTSQGLGIKEKTAQNLYFSTLSLFFSGLHGVHNIIDFRIGRQTSLLIRLFSSVLCKLSIGRYADAKRVMPTVYCFAAVLKHPELIQTMDER
jgi:hypothetical protein